MADPDTQTSAVFDGLNGHTYAFRSRARDYANNREAYGAADDSTSLDTTPPTVAAFSPR